MRQLIEYKDKHIGEHIIVCGLGKSILELPLEYLQSNITIGVNDIGRLFQPTYLTLLDKQNKFTPERWIHIKESKAQQVFSQLPPDQLPFPKEQTTHIQFQGFRGANLNMYSLGQSLTSPYAAIEIAYIMGASRISIIGVDFTPDHFYAATGTHALNNRLRDILTDFKELKEALDSKGVILDLLTPNSALASILPINYISI